MAEWWRSATAPPTTSQLVSRLAGALAGALAIPSVSVHAPFQHELCQLLICMLPACCSRMRSATGHCCHRKDS
eukprot:10894403-Alexandrium_andersonii.AAC.2